MPMNPKLLRPRGAYQPAVSPGQPDQIAGLELWLDASDATTLTSSGGFVSQINDKSGNGRHFVQPDSGLRPTTATVNGKGVLGFLGQWMYQENADDYANATTVLVFSRDGSAAVDAYSGIFGYRSNFTEISPLVASDDFFELRSAGETDGTPIGIDTNVAGGAAAWVNGQLATLDAGAFEQVFNPCPVDVADQLCVVAVNTAQSASSGSKMPSLGVENYDAARTYNMKLAEVIVYSSELTAEQRQGLEGYLMAKWAIV